MRHGWESYVKHQPIDGLLVFNDDVILYESALASLIEASEKVSEQAGSEHAVVGPLQSTNRDAVTYGGLRRASDWHPLRFERAVPGDEIQQVDTLNMNCALIRSEALDRVGFLSTYFRHNCADIEFGLKLRKAGGSVWLAPDIVGECDRNPVEGTSKEAGIDEKEQFRRLTSVKEQPMRQRMRYFRAHGGAAWPLLWAGPYLRVAVQGIRNRIARSRDDRV